MQEYDYISIFGKEKVVFIKDRYAAGNSLYIGMLSKEQYGEGKDECYYEPYADVTVNILGEDIEGRQAFLDTNNMPGIDRFLLSIGAGKPVGRLGFSGYCAYPLFEFSEEFINSLSE